MLAALMIGHHLSISAFWNAANPSKVCSSRVGISWPKSASRSFTLGSANAWATALLSLISMGLGVPLGAHMPDQTETWRPGTPASSTVGISGAAGNRVLAVAREGFGL